MLKYYSRIFEIVIYVVATIGMISSFELVPFYLRINFLLAGLIVCLIINLTLEKRIEKIEIHLKELILLGKKNKIDIGSITFIVLGLSNIIISIQTGLNENYLFFIIGIIFFFNGLNFKHRNYYIALTKDSIIKVGMLRIKTKTIRSVHLNDNVYHLRSDKKDFKVFLSELNEKETSVLIEYLNRLKNNHLA